jgi:hypothetical protein
MIDLFTTFYIADPERQEELLYCLNKNVQNTHIQNIYLLLDGKNEDLVKECISQNISNTDKIKYLSVGRVPTYGDWVEQSQKLNDTLAEISVFANADIYVDETITQLKDFTKQKDSIVCLTRHEVIDELNVVLHPNPQWSQDFWAISKENILNIRNSFFLDELRINYTGVYRCDNKTAYIFAMRGWTIFNPYPLIKCYHVQKNSERSYNKLATDTVGGLCFPAPTDSPDNPSVLDISIMPVKVGNIKKCAINNYLERNLFSDSKKNNENPPKQLNEVSHTDIVFFGASVTKQKEGYVEYFKKQNPEYVVDQIAVGATHIKDAGVCFLPQVLQKKPKYCFLDWFTPALEQYTAEQLKHYLFFIISQLFDIACTPILLFFNGDGSGLNFKNKIDIFDLIIKDVCENYNVPYIKVYEITQQLGYTDKEILRDDVHTNSFGSELYGTIITDKFKKIIKQNNNINFAFKPPKTNYINIKCKPLNAVIKNKILIKGDAEIIGIFQKIGPFTSWVNVSIDGNPFKERCLIDKHCYYTRDCFNFSYIFKNSLELVLSKKTPDYSICKNPIDYGVKNWEEYYNRHEKKLHFNEIYYIGEITEITYE